MPEHQLTLIDVDENPFVVWLRDDRIQLAAVDSRPELEADALHMFAATLFARYCAPPLAARLDATRSKLIGVRDRLAASGSSDALVAALDGALCALFDVRRGVTVGMASAPVDPPTPKDPDELPPLEELAAPLEELAAPLDLYAAPEALRAPASTGEARDVISLASRRKRPPRGTRAGERVAASWGSLTSSSCRRP
jgi:hypothetical protein